MLVKLVAPDYILVNRKVKNELIQSFKQSIERILWQNIQNSPDFGRIVNTKHFNRLSELLAIHRNEVILVGIRMKMNNISNLQF